MPTSGPPASRSGARAAPRSPKSAPRGFERDAGRRGPGSTTLARNPLRRGAVGPDSAEVRPRWIPAGLAFATLVLWQFPWGQYALYPFTLLATYAHEMGHGLTAALLGQDFVSLRLFPDASGVAHWQGDAGRIGRGIIAAGGLMGPSLAGGALLAATRVRRASRWLLLTMGLFAAASVFLVVRNTFGVLFVGGFAAAAFAVVRFRPRWSPLTVQILAVELALSVFRDIDYMFSSTATVAGVARPSDTGVMAEALILPYWFWGVVVALFSLGAVAAGAWIALGRRR